MSTHNTARERRAIPSSRLAAGFVTALALFSVACSDSTAPVPSAGRLMTASAQASNSTSDYALLANQAVTCTDGKITGSVGTNQAAPTGSVTRTSCPITGSVDVGTGSSQAAYAAFVAQYTALTPALGECTTANTLTGTLAGDSLASGTYCVSAEAKTGLLTLTGSGTWTFKVLGALTGTSFTVLLADGGSACNVTWWVEAASTMTDSHFVGTILAAADITLTRGTFDGNAYSQADVTVTGADVTGCDGSTNGGGGTPTGSKCNQGVGNGSEGCDPGKSNHNQVSNDETGGTPKNPGRRP